MTKTIENITLLSSEDFKDKWKSKFCREWKEKNEEKINKLKVELIAINN